MCIDTDKKSSATRIPAKEMAASEKLATYNSTSSNKDNDSEMPLLCRFWTGVDAMLPRIRIAGGGGGGLDCSILSASTILFCLFRWCVRWILVNWWGWPDAGVHEDTDWAVASAAGILHSTVLVPTLCTLFFASGIPYNPSGAWPSSGNNDKARWWSTTVHAALQWCTAYMVSDTVLTFTPKILSNSLGVSDFIFIGHHAVTALYMTHVRVIERGHQSALMCMLLGESTNPLHNSFYFLEVAVKHGTFSKFWLDAVRLAFSAQYCMVRILVGPAVCVHMTYNLLRYRKQIGTVTILTWIAAIWAVILGSYPWVEEAWNVVTAAAVNSKSSTGTEEL